MELQDELNNRVVLNVCILKQGSIPAHNDLIVIVLTDIGRH